MMNTLWWHKAKPWVIQIGLFLMIGLSVWFGFLPLHRLITEKMDTIQQLDVLREYRGNEIQRLPELEKQNSLIDARGKELSIILSKEALVGFIEDLEKLAVEEGVKIEIASRDNTLLESKITNKEVVKNKKDAVALPDGDTSTPNPTVVDKRKGKGGSGLIDTLPLKRYIRLTLTIKGTYAAMVSYLHRVETMPYAIEVIGMTIKEALKETEEAYAETGDLNQAGGTVAPSIETPPLDRNLPAILATDLDFVIYTKE